MQYYNTIISCLTCHGRYSVCYRSSGVTRVGDTLGGNWGCHPSIFSWRTWRPFLLIAVTMSPFLPVRPRFSTILCKFAHKFFFLRVSLTGGCHQGQSTPPRIPPSDATAIVRCGAAIIQWKIDQMYIVLSDVLNHLRLMAGGLWTPVRRCN